MLLIVVLGFLTGLFFSQPVFWDAVVETCEIVYGIFTDHGPFDDWKFDRKIWQENTNNEDPDNVRGMMIYDLTENYLKKGMSKNKVQELLGRPDFTQYTDEDLKMYSVWKYTIGAWSGLGWDYDSLNIYFKDDRYDKFAVIQY